jgi:hypothetical protein
MKNLEMVLHVFDFAMLLQCLIYLRLSELGISDYD